MSNESTGPNFDRFGGCGVWWQHEKVAPNTEAKKPEVVPVVTVTIDNPIVQKAIREQLKKTTGELTKADLEKVTKLNLGDKQLTEVPKGLEKLNQLTHLNLAYNKLTDVKGLEKLTQLKSSLSLYGNPDLTKAQINELKKALPKCNIYSDPKK